jgi:hypothetical protein
MLCSLFSLNVNAKCHESIDREENRPSHFFRLVALPLVDLDDVLASVLFLVTGPAVNGGAGGRLDDGGIHAAA